MPIADKIAVYVRVSTKDQNVESQVQAISRYLAAHAIEPLKKHWFIDDGISGRTMNRAGFKRLKRAIPQPNREMPAQRLAHHRNPAARRHKTPIPVPLTHARLQIPAQR